MNKNSGCLLKTDVSDDLQGVHLIKNTSHLQLVDIAITCPDIREKSPIKGILTMKSENNPSGPELKKWPVNTQPLQNTRVGLMKGRTVTVLLFTRTVIDLRKGISTRVEDHQEGDNLNRRILFGITISIGPDGWNIIFALLFDDLLVVCSTTLSCFFWDWPFSLSSISFPLFSCPDYFYLKLTNCFFSEVHYFTFDR